MSKDKVKSNINAFWEWFEANERLIKDVLDNENHQNREEIIQSLDNQILEFGLFKWEIGSGVDKAFSLTISPNASKDLLQISKHIINHAPDLPDWEFHPAKPARDWDLKFLIYDDLLNEYAIDASSWKFSLEKALTNKVNILIEAPDIEHLDTEIQLDAGDFVVTSELGEEEKIQHVHKIMMVKVDEQLKKPIVRLKSELKKLLY